MTQGDRLLRSRRIRGLNQIRLGGQLHIAGETVRLFEKDLKINRKSQIKLTLLERAWALENVRVAAGLQTSYSLLEDYVL